MQPPERHPNQHHADTLAKCQHQIGHHQHGKAQDQQPGLAHPVGQHPDRPGGQGIDHVHHHQHPRQPDRLQPHLAGAQDQERLGKPRHGHRHPQPDRDPHPRPQGGKAGAVQARALFRCGLDRRLVHEQHQDRHRYHRRNDGKGKHRADIARQQQHQRYRHQWPGKRPHRVERLAQPVSRAMLGGLHQIGHQRIARRPPDALAHPIGQPCRQNPDRRARQREQRLGHRT